MLSGSQSDDLGYSVDELAWLYEYEQADARNRSNSKEDPVEQAVDMLLSCYWL